MEEGPGRTEPPPSLSALAVDSEEEEAYEKLPAASATLHLTPLTETLLGS